MWSQSNQVYRNTKSWNTIPTSILLYYERYKQSNTVLIIINRNYVIIKSSKHPPGMFWWVGPVCMQTLTMIPTSCKLARSFGHTRLVVTDDMGFIQYHPPPVCFKESGEGRFPLPLRIRLLEGGILVLLLTQTLYWKLLRTYLFFIWAAGTLYTHNIVSGDHNIITGEAVRT